MKRIDGFFLICRIFAIFIGFYHANKFFFPEGSDATRYLVFVGINVIVIYGLWKRPTWFLYFFGALIIQQWYSHGNYIWQLWQTKHLIDWKSIAIIILMPIIFIALIKEKKHAPQVFENS